MIYKYGECGSETVFIVERVSNPKRGVWGYGGVRIAEKSGKSGTKCPHSESNIRIKQGLSLIHI